jgi:acetate kinase
MPTPLLVVNAGSSSVKFAVYAADGLEPRLRCRGQIESLGESLGTQPHLRVHDAEGRAIGERTWPEPLTHAQSVDALRDWLDANGTVPQAVGHRVVHGGTRFAAPMSVDAGVLRELDALVPLAPLHQPHNLAIVRAIAAREPTLPQVACFDTAFHRTMPEVAQRFALPRTWHDAGVRRYGFHGLSYEFIARRLRELDPGAAAGRVVVAHLGAGASLCAMDGGRSVDTTMSFTALDGLPMGTRAGSTDPGVLLYLLQQHGMSAAELSRLLYFESGLLGVSGVSGDMRQLMTSGEPAARQAIELFVYRTARELGAMVAVLGGLDALVFTAGIGENNAAIRAAICERARFLRLELDPRANEKHATVISSVNAAVKVFVLPTDEERMIALHTQALLARKRDSERTST